MDRRVLLAHHPAGAGAPPRAAAGGPPPGNDPTNPAQLLEALDWATRENARADSDLRSHLDLTRVATGGHSCGGLQALAISNDPRIDTTLVLDSGIYIRPGGRSGVAIDKTQLPKLHGPVFYLTGGPSDIAHENALDDFEKLQHVPVVMASLPVGHGGTFSAPDGGDWARVSLRWLDWQLKGDANAAKEFVGPTCGLCTDSRWTVKQKNLPTAAASGQVIRWRHRSERHLGRAPAFHRRHRPAVHRRPGARCGAAGSLAVGHRAGAACGGSFDRPPGSAAYPARTWNSLATCPHPARRRRTWTPCSARGISAVTLAGNHIADCGEEGIVDTVSRLDTLGIA